VVHFYNDFDIVETPFITNESWSNDHYSWLESHACSNEESRLLDDRRRSKSSHMNSLLISTSFNFGVGKTRKRPACTTFQRAALVSR